MFGSVPVSPRALEDYRPILGDERVEELRKLGDGLRGARVLHVNSTAFGGGVAELLSSLVPLMSDLGLAADWQVMKGADEFFQVTKVMHNALQGMFIPWLPQMQDIWLRYNQLNADLFDDHYDFVVVHDLQPAGLRLMTRQRLEGEGTKWIWRCHIDLTEAINEVWDFLRPFVEAYDAAIFTLKEYVKEDLVAPQVFVVPPAIDPLSPKNMNLPAETVVNILQRYGVDAARPMMLQVSRFDPWKDPLGVIEVYREVKRHVPDLQLVMVASMANDDPEGWAYFERTARRAGEDYDIHLLSNLTGVGNVEVNAFQRAASVVVQKSVREGFGLTVSEALWKERPVVAGNVGGLPLQIVSGKTGYLVSSVSECADRVIALLSHPRMASRMGRAGREHVRQNFLITRYLRDYLRLFHLLSGKGQGVLGALENRTGVSP